MEFAFFGRIYREPDAIVTLRDTWFVAEDELNAISGALKKLCQDDPEISKLHRKVAWLSQAIIEFTDLLGMHLPRRGRWQHTNYLFFEGLSALRESAISLLNGSSRASLGLLRTSLEMFLLHCWWHRRLFLEETFEPFYERLDGRKRFASFRDVLRDNHKFLEIPGGESSLNQTYQTYQRLCSYVHAPLLHESITTISKGNRPGGSRAAFVHCLTMSAETLERILQHLIFHKPQSLFPVDITRKFAFSPPVGMFFDQYNLVSLRAALGDSLIEEYRTTATKSQAYKDVMAFYNSQPDLSPEQIQETWNEEEYGSDCKENTPKDIDGRWQLVKARMRVVSMVLSYRALETAHVLRGL